MATNLSTGLRAAIMAGHQMPTILQDGVIRCYSGPQPVDADRAVTGTLLGSITRDGGPFTPGVQTNGLRFTRSGIYLLKDPNQPWRFDGVANGTLGWFRVCANAPDDGLDSPNAIRMDGAAGLAGSIGDYQMLFNSLEITPSTGVDIPGFIFAFQPLPSV